MYQPWIIIFGIVPIGAIVGGVLGLLFARRDQNFFIKLVGATVGAILVFYVIWTGMTIFHPNVFILCGFSSFGSLLGGILGMYGISRFLNR